jgi:hypothetical protein
VEAAYFLPGKFAATHFLSGAALEIEMVHGSLAPHKASLFQIEMSFFADT